MATTVFEIVPEEIERMVVDQFVDLVTTLMLDEGVRLGIPPNEIRVTRRIYDPDGGADAITDAGTEKGRYFAPGLTVWQFKKSWPDLGKLAGEVGKDFTAEIGTGATHRKGEAAQSPRTCGRILALHRALGAPKPMATVPHEARPMPFAAQRRHQYWSGDVRYIEDHALGTGKPVYVISILENFSRALLASAISPRQDLTAYLIVLRAAIETHGAPEVLVSDGGGVFRANHARAIYAALGIAKREIDPGQAWQNYIEPHFGIMRRMADYHYGQATTWAELQAVHDRFFHDYDHQPHAAHGDRPKGRRSPAAVLGWVQGAWCAPADLDRLFRLRATRVLNAAGSVRFRHGRFYGERGLASERAAVWVDGETLTLEYATDTLARYRVATEADGRGLREVDEPRLYETGHASPQPFLPELEGLDWRPAQRLAPYRPRRPRRDAGRQERLPVPEPDERAG